MTRSARTHRNLPLRSDLAAALAKPYHVKDDGSFEASQPPPPQGDGAAGGVISTVEDLARFDIALDHGRLISSHAVEMAMSPRRNGQGELLPYGLGWFTQTLQGHRVVWHSGWWEKAYSALYIKIPDRDLTVILLANSEGVWWDNPLDRAEVEKSPFARLVFDELVR